jgi:hypothetical protein
VKELSDKELERNKISIKVVTVQQLQEKELINKGKT